MCRRALRLEDGLASRPRAQRCGPEPGRGVTGGGRIRFGSGLLSTRMASTDTTQTTAGRELVRELASRHASSMLAVARRYSLCADDAQDACQRALEILLRRADSLDPAGAPAWLRTVVKHEALAIRAARRRIVGPAEVDLDRTEAGELEPADERALDGERMGRSTEALARLKPQEVRALVLKAQGYSYREIAEITNWTYTKVNRCLTEGRRAFLDRYAEIEAGRECGRWAPALSALADGEASAEDVAALRPHLRHCPSCRASLREFRAAPGAVAAVAGPVALAGPAASLPEPLNGDGDGPSLVARAWEAVAGGLHERVLLSSHKLHAGIEAVSAGKVAAVAASATAVAGSGAAALQREAAPPAPVRAAVARPAPSAPARTSPLGTVAPKPAPAPTRSAPGTADRPAPARAQPRPQEPEPVPPSEFAPTPEASSPESTQSAPAPSAAAPPARAGRAEPAADTPSTEFGP
jgi:RNA polymerase sigma factor (sigma-70 family)